MPVSVPLVDPASSGLSVLPQPLQLQGVCVNVSGVTILDVPELRVAAGAHLGIAGVSGSGKTTLLQVIAGLRRPDRGRVKWGDTDIAGLPPAAGDAWRRTAVGLVFQDFHLIAELSALENVLLPVGFAQSRLPAALAARARHLLAAMDVTRPLQLVGRMSRGEQQRVAIARACLLSPQLILADEPTASLDRPSASAVADLLVAVAGSLAATLIVVSHDEQVLARLGTTRTMRDLQAHALV
jgi:putative ABC transport system ATP-binding protein